MMFALPVLALVVCFCLVVVTCHAQALRIVELETALQLQVYSQRLEQRRNAPPESLREAREAAEEAARVALEKQKVL
jgi:hypothetical protein